MKAVGYETAVTKPPLCTQEGSERALNPGELLTVGGTCPQTQGNLQALSCAAPASCAVRICSHRSCLLPFTAQGAQREVINRVPCPCSQGIIAGALQHGITSAVCS